NRLTVHAKGEPREMVQDSAEQFIAEHYWGYCAHPDGSSLEYRVEHPPWRIWEMEHAEFAGDAQALYGAEFAGILNKSPDSAFLAEGSAVAIHTARRLTYPRLVAQAFLPVRFQFRQCAQARMPVRQSCKASDPISPSS